jgi:hypothetical protein
MTAAVINDDKSIFYNLAEQVSSTFSASTTTFTESLGEGSSNKISKHVQGKKNLAFLLSLQLVLMIKLASKYMWMKRTMDSLRM